MTRSSAAILVFLATVFTSSGIAYAVDTAEELKVCAGITDKDARLACFDNLGERVLQAEPADKAPTQEETAQPEVETASTTGVQPLPEDLGGSKDIQYAGLITSCKQGHYGDWYFFFDNGQVWKEVSNRNLRFKECNFNATITRDAFGYKMKIDGVKRNIRVRRNR